MTIEMLLECSADQLEKMSDAELLQHFSKYLNVTRPDMAIKPSSAPKTPFINPTLSKAIGLLKEKGIELPVFSDKLTMRKK